MFLLPHLFLLGLVSPILYQNHHRLHLVDQSHVQFDMINYVRYTWHFQQSETQMRNKNKLLSYNVLLILITDTISKSTFNTQAVHIGTGLYTLGQSSVLYMHTLKHSYTTYSIPALCGINQHEIRCDIQYMYM